MLRILLLLTAFASAASAQGFHLGLARTYPAGAEPLGVAVADLDGDGNADVVTTLHGVDSVAVRLGDGTGALGPAKAYATGNHPGAVALADLDGDFILDLVVSNAGSANVSFRHGLLHGLFAPKTDLIIGGQPAGIGIGDLNGDGKPDAAIANPSINAVTVLAGGGPNGLVPGFVLSMGPAPIAVAVVDLDHDGVDDVVAASSSKDSLYVRRGVAAGGFGPLLRFVVNGLPSGLTIGDVNNDGFEDAVVANVNPFADVLLNDGAGSFQAPLEFQLGGPASAIVIGDVDNDGVPDLSSVNPFQTSLGVNRGLGGGQFAIPVIYTPVGASGCQGLALGDFDGDGRRDYVVASQTPARLTVLLGNGLGPFGPPADIVSGDQPDAVAVGDITGDGFPEIASANYQDANVSVFTNSGTGTFSAATPYAMSNYPASVVLVDLNGDGKKDLVAGGFSTFESDTNRVSVRLNAGTGAFGARVDYDAARRPCAALAAGEVTGDGKTDVVVGHGSFGVAVLPGNGAGALGAAVPYTTHGDPYGVHLADLDANGKLDLVVADRTANVVSVLLNGAGGFGSAVDFQTGNWPLSIASRDLDGDGKLDLAVANVFGGGVSFLKGDGLGAFAPRVDLPLGSVTPLALDTGDLNRDGLPDLLVGLGGPQMGLLYGKGGGTFTAPVLIDAGTDQAEVRLADFDGNGTLDAVTANESDVTISVFLGRQRTRTALTVSPNPSAVGTMLTYTATVTKASPDAADPTGPVRFYDGFTLLGSAPVIGGVATLTQPASLRWDRILSAEYSGDGRFFASYAPSVPHQTYVPTVAVDPRPGSVSALALAPLRQPCRAGELAVRFTLAGGEPASLELYDVRGRRLAARRVSGDAGSVTFAEAKAAGVYQVRLVQDGQTAITRAVVL